MITDRIRSFTPRIFVVAALLGALLAGCDSGGDSDDDSDENGYFLRFDANGSRVSFTQRGALWATFAQSGTQHNAVFTGYNAQSNMGLQIYSTAPIEEGTYTGYQFSGNAIVGILIYYQDPNGITYTSGINPPATTRITVEEITSRSVRGTFEGRLTEPGHPDMIITNGVFVVERANERAN